MTVIILLKSIEIFNIKKLWIKIIVDSNDSKFRKMINE